MVGVTYYGHSCFMVDLKGTKILFDPFITGNEATNGVVDLNTIMPDYILVTHGHFDHIQDVEAIAKQSGATVVANFEVATYFQGKGIDNVIPMNHGGTVDLNGIAAKAVNAVHTSSFPDGNYAGQPLGFVLSWDGLAFYYSGDTALTYDMKLISEEYQLDFAFLCLGDHFTMGISDAIKAAEFVGTQNIIGMHFDTFDPIMINHKKAIDAFAKTGKTLKLPEIGESFSMEESVNRDMPKKNFA